MSLSCLSRVSGSLSSSPSLLVSMQSLEMVLKSESELFNFIISCLAWSAVPGRVGYPPGSCAVAETSDRSFNNSSPFL